MMFLSKYMLHPTHKVVFLADYSKLEAEKVYDKFLVEAKNRYRDFKFAMGDLQWNQETIQYFMLEDDMFPVLIIHWNNPDPNIQDTVYRNVHIDHVEDLGLILDASLEQYNNNTKVLQGYREKAERGELEEKYKSQEVPKHNTMPVKVSSVFLLPSTAHPRVCNTLLDCPQFCRSLLQTRGMSKWSMLA